MLIESDTYSLSTTQPCKGREILEQEMTEQDIKDFKIVLAGINSKLDFMSLLMFIYVVAYIFFK